MPASFSDLAKRSLFLPFESLPRILKISFAERDQLKFTVRRYVTVHHIIQGENMMRRIHRYWSSLSFDAPGRALFFLASILWIVSLFIPAIQYSQIGPGTPATAFGIFCLMNTLIPYLWFAIPWIFVPLLLVNVGTIFTAISFFQKTKPRVARWHLAWVLLSIPIAIGLTQLIAIRLYVGFYLWILSLLVLFVALAIKFRSYVLRSKTDGNQSNT